MLRRKVKLGFVPANRGLFSDTLAAQMRARTVKVLKGAGAAVVVPSPRQTKVGCVETIDEAVLVGRMFRDQRVDGIVISAVNFGDEQAVAVAVKECGLSVPVLIVGCPEQEALKPTTERRDSFCGLLSIGEVLRQLDVPYSVPEKPICQPEDESFHGTVSRFAAVCRVVGGLRGARYGQVGARPDAFWTCRYSEKALQRLGPTVVTLDLSEVFAAVRAMKTNAAVRRVIAEMAKTIDCKAVGDEQLAKIAKFELVLRRFVEDKNLDGLAVQCWTSMQQNLGICACATMGRFDDRGVPSACEADIMGTLSMHALQLAGEQPSCLADWNNIHNDDPELINCWHCGVFPPSWARATPKMGCHEIVATATGRENAMGVVEFVMTDGPVTLCRATQDNDGRFKAVLAQGAVEPSKACTFGAYGWVRIPGIQRLYKNVLLRHFPHHVAMTRGQVGNVLWEAFGNYLGFEMFTASSATGGPWDPELPFGQE
ncbi:MAG TPA: L-fucose/L-arabinose isomerase family protein [Phycisphaerae bacterium]|nr:L-fucose/L-arabinose isomerase family protein [Phycisphaerae bacterium]